MDTFSSRVLENIRVPPECYPSEAVLHDYMNRESLLRHTLFNTEFDCYSDISLESSSYSLNSIEYLNYAIQEQKRLSLLEDSLGSSSMQYGRGTLTHSESLKSSRWSDDDMSEYLPFDQTIRLSPQVIVNEEEERRYLTELLRQDMVAAELGYCYPETLDNAHFSTERLVTDVPRDLYQTSPDSVREDLQDNLRPKRGNFLHKDELPNLYWHNLPVKTNPNSNRTLRNPNSRKNNTENQSPARMYRKENLIHTSKAKKDRADSPLSKKDKKKKLKSTGDDAQRVFLGGLPIGITERMLRQHLATLGYKVLKRPKILHGFAPDVWMRTVDQAKHLINRGTIIIEGSEVEVRPYNSLTKLSELKKLPNVGKRSVFIGGLSSCTTTKHLQDVFSEMGMKVINYPVIKHGFVRQVILDTVSQAESLIRMRKIKVNGTFVDVRPFVNQNRRRRTK